MKKERKKSSPELVYLEKVKRLALVAMFSDDELMEKLVLKGGNAIDLVYGVSIRSSIDIDLSIGSDFNQPELEMVKAKTQKSLIDTFDSEGYAVFDFEFSEEPKELSPELEGFWGGYEIRFKVLEKSKYAQLKDSKDSLRRNALVVGPRQRRKFIIQISKYEFCEKKQGFDFEGYRIYLYSPEMIVFEKLRAICQQMPEYREKVKSGHNTARSRDFIDIHCLIKEFGIRVDTEENMEMLGCIFAAKKVPIELLGKIHLYREFHKEDFNAVKDTVKAGTELKEFDYYFDYVLKICETLKSLWEEQPPLL